MNNDYDDDEDSGDYEDDATIVTLASSTAVDYGRPKMVTIHKRK